MIQVQSSLIDICISTVFIILLFSLFHSGVLELIQTYGRFRNHFLYKKLNELLNDRTNYNLSEKIYDHPIIQSTKPKASSTPAYLSTELFSEALIGVLSRLYPLDTMQLDDAQKLRMVVFQKEVNNLDPKINLLNDIKVNLAGLRYSKLKILLTDMIAPCQTIEEFKQKLSDWYDGYMERVSSMYKKSLLKWSMIIGVLISVACNANLIVIVKSLRENSLLNSRISNLAIQSYNSGRLNEMVGAANSSQDANTNVEPSIELVKAQKDTLISLYNLIQDLGLPIGWGKAKNPEKMPDACWYQNFRGSELPTIILGYLLMGLAISFGSEYWFNILSKFINIRGVIKPDSTSPSKK